jgi:hypothetical protein
MMASIFSEVKTSLFLFALAFVCVLQGTTFVNPRVLDGIRLALYDCESHTSSVEAEVARRRRWRRRRWERRPRLFERVKEV